MRKADTMGFAMDGIVTKTQWDCSITAREGCKVARTGLEETMVLLLINVG